MGGHACGAMFVNEYLIFSNEGFFSNIPWWLKKPSDSLQHMLPLNKDWGLFLDH